MIYKNSVKDIEKVKIIQKKTVLQEKSNIRNKREQKSIIDDKFYF